MNNLKDYNIVSINIKVDSYNYIYYVNYNFKNENKVIEFIEPTILGLTDIKRIIRRLERKDNK